MTLEASLAAVALGVAVGLERSWPLEDRLTPRRSLQLVLVGVGGYVVLPADPVGPWNALDLRAAWLLVVLMCGIGVTNHLLVSRFGARAVGLVGFVGALVNSTAVVGEVASRSRSDGSLRHLAVGAILLADAAMAARNLLIVLVFAPSLVPAVGVPLVAIALVAAWFARRHGSWQRDRVVGYERPFDPRSALTVGVLFCGVLVATAASEATFGTAGFLASSLLGGLVSSGSVTATAVLLAGAGTIDTGTAVMGIVAATAASILVKVALAASIDRRLVWPVLTLSLLLLVVGAGSGVLVLTLA